MVEDKREGRGHRGNVPLVYGMFHVFCGTLGIVCPKILSQLRPACQTEANSTVAATVASSQLRAVA